MASRFYSETANFLLNSLTVRRCLSNFIIPMHKNMTGSSTCLTVMTYSEYISLYRDLNYYIFCTCFTDSQFDDFYSKFLILKERKFIFEKDLMT